MQIQWKKRNMRRCLALLLACALFTLMLPATGAFAGSVDFNTNTIKVYEWKQIKTQEDFPAAGTYPMLLCYTDQSGVHRFMKHTSIDDSRANIYRDGLTNSNKEARRNIADARAAAEYLLLDAETRASMTLEKYRETLPYWNRAWEYPFRNADYLIAEEGVNCIYSTPVSECPEIAMTCESFYTTTMPTEWKLVVTGNTSSKMAKVHIHVGDQELYDDAANVDEAEIELGKIGGHSDDNTYLVYTRELGGGRAKYTDEGCVQIFYDDPTWLGTDTGLLWDSKKFGGVEGDKDYYSNFKIFYGVEKTFSVIDKDYVIGNGNTMYANNNLMLLDGVNLTVAPGGILCVTGTFFNNGIIHNCGTVVINPGSKIDSLHPTDAGSGQLNCYGGISAEVSVYSSYTPREESAETAGMSTDELEMKVSEMSVYLYDARKMLENTDPATVSAEQLAYMEEYIADMEAALAIYEEALEARGIPEGYEPGRRQTGSTVYKNCQGDLIIMEGGALVLNDQSQSKLNLYEGASCVNNGLIVAPNGITLTDAELINRSRGTIFSGYGFDCAQGGDIGKRVVNPGAGSASLPDLVRRTGSISAFSVNGSYHVNNQGGILVNGSMSGGTGYFDGNAITY